VPDDLRSLFPLLGPNITQISDDPNTPTTFSVDYPGSPFASMDAEELTVTILPSINLGIPLTEPFLMNFSITGRDQDGMVVAQNTVRHTSLSESLSLPALGPLRMNLSAEAQFKSFQATYAYTYDSVQAQQQAQQAFHANVQHLEIKVLRN
jgi:hypothetical protein